MTQLILLRPTEGAEQSAIIAREKGFNPIIAPATEINALTWDAPPAQGFDAIMITSANALRHGGEAIHQYKHLPLYAVGKATAKLAEEMGFTIAAIGKGGAKALWPLIKQSDAKNIVRLVGRDYVPIYDEHIQICTIIVYEARALPMHEGLQSLLSETQNKCPHIFAFHSAKAVQIFDDYIEQMAKQGLIFDKSAHYAAALAPTIGEAICKNGDIWKKVIISSSANDRVMIEEISEVLGA